MQQRRLSTRSGRREALKQMESTPSSITATRRSTRIRSSETCMHIGLSVLPRYFTYVIPRNMGRTCYNAAETVYLEVGQYCTRCFCWKQSKGWP
jgi:hypothetical protein